MSKYIKISYKSFINESMNDEDKYWLNNCSWAIEIYNTDRFNAGSNRSYSKPDTDTMNINNIQNLIKFIKTHPEKSISIGMRTNATSTPLRKVDFLILAELFPHLVKI